MDLKGMTAAMYLRKSRAEDGLDTAEILRRHRETLTEYAAREGVRVTETFQEVKSGESLYARPEMMRLLEAVEAGRFQAVLCMDIDRLSRGETRERGLIWSAFKASGTLIATPAKVYDLSEESDELMTELRGLFAHYELTKIKERTRRGMIRAAKEGCHLSYAPYGYRRKTVEKRRTLEIYEPEAQFVRLAFDLYAAGKGCDAIATRLNELGARPRRADAFTRTTILKMIKNPVYAGKIVYNREQWTRKDGKIGVRIRPESEWVVSDGLHKPIVDAETFAGCQDILRSRWRQPYFDGGIKSPLAGLVRCRRCGKLMYRIQADGIQRLHCLTRGCSASSRFDLVESRVIGTLREMLLAREIAPDAPSEAAKAAAESRLAEIEKAIGAETRKRKRIYDAYENGAYDVDEYRGRMGEAKARLSALERQQDEARAELERLSNADGRRQAAALRTLLEAYQAADGAGRNALLKAVVDVIMYEKPKGAEPDGFDIEIFLHYDFKSASLRGIQGALLKC